MHYTVNYYGFDILLCASYKLMFTGVLFYSSHPDDLAIFTNKVCNHHLKKYGFSDDLNLDGQSIWRIGGVDHLRYDNNNIMQFIAE